VTDNGSEREPPVGLLGIGMEVLINRESSNDIAEANVPVSVTGVELLGLKGVKLISNWLAATPQTSLVYSSLSDSSLHDIKNMLMGIKQYRFTT